MHILVNKTSPKAAIPNVHHGKVERFALVWQARGALQQKHDVEYLFGRASTNAHKHFQWEDSDS